MLPLERSCYPATQTNPHLLAVQGPRATGHEDDLLHRPVEGLDHRPTEALFDVEGELCVIQSRACYLQKKTPERRISSSPGFLRLRSRISKPSAGTSTVLILTVHLRSCLIESYWCQEVAGSSQRRFCSPATASLWPLMTEGGYLQTASNVIANRSSSSILCSW